MVTLKELSAVVTNLAAEIKSCNDLRLSYCLRPGLYLVYTHRR